MTLHNCLKMLYFKRFYMFEIFHTKSTYVCIFVCAYNRQQRKCYVFVNYHVSVSFQLYSRWAFSECSRTGQEHKSPLPKICHTNPTMIKLGTVIPYLKKIQEIYESCSTSHWILLTSAFFHWKPANFVMSRNIDKDCILIHNF